MIKAAYLAERVRGNLAIAAGTYMNANYAAEQGVLKNVYEANAGFKIGKKDLWLDVGIFPSHIGFESAIGKDNRTVTRSILADNSPYYEAGAKIGFTTADEKWFFSGLILNGWQRIKRVDGNSLMSFGIQVTHKPSGKATLNYSNFIGTDKPDSARQMRYFHNLYCIIQVSKKINVTAGFDIGWEEKKNVPGKTNWYSPVVIGSYTINDKWSMTARGEYYFDKAGVIIATGTSKGFQTVGFSVNADHAPAKNLLFRAEVRSLQSKDAIFVKDTGFKNHNVFMTAAFALSF